MYRSVAIEKTIDVAELQANLENILLEVCERHVAVIVERTNGAPVVMISMEEYWRLREIDEHRDAETFPQTTMGPSIRNAGNWIADWHFYP